MIKENENPFSTFGALFKYEKEMFYSTCVCFMQFEAPSELHCSVMHP